MLAQDSFVIQFSKATPNLLLQPNIEGCAMQTTLNKIRSHSPCQDGWQKLLKHLGKTTSDDVPLPLLTVLNSNGFDDALWCLRAVDGHNQEIRLYAVWCARQAQHLMTDPRSTDALDVAEKFAQGNATQAELAAAYDAACDAARAAASAAAYDAAYDAARAAASAAARAAAYDAAWAAARTAQEARLREILSEPTYLPKGVR